jgi:hypothetical protein
MRFTQKLIPAILSAALLVSATGDAAWADTTSPQPPSLRCADGACTVQLPLDGLSPLAKAGAALGLTALQSQTDALPAGTRLAIDDQLTLTLPLGEITLPKAQLDIEMGPDNQIARLHGVVETPFPTLGVLSDVRMVQPARAEVGLDSGANLSRLAAPLDPDRQYLFFNISSGMDMAGKVAATGDMLSLSAPAGQALTLVIDTEEPLVYLAGNVTVNTSGELLLAGPLQELAQQSELIPDGLPLRQRTQITVSGLAGKNADEYLNLGGSWSVGAGALGRWLGVEATPLAVEGLLTLSADGLLLDGVVRSSIEPDKVLDSSAQLTAFIPFKGGVEDAFVETQAAVAIPLAKVDVDGSARLDLATAGDAATRFAATTANALPKIDTRPAAAALQGALAAVRQQAASGAQTAQKLASRSGAWLATLSMPDLSKTIQLPRVAAQQ